MAPPFAGSSGHGRSRMFNAPGQHNQNNVYPWTPPNRVQDGTRPRRELDWGSIGQRRRATHTGNFASPSNSHSTESDVNAPQLVDNGSGHLVDDYYHDAPTASAPVLGSPIQFFNEQPHHDTSYGGSAPALQFENGGWQPHGPHHDISAESTTDGQQVHRQSDLGGSAAEFHKRAASNNELESFLLEPLSPFTAFPRRTEQLIAPTSSTELQLSIAHHTKEAPSNTFAGDSGDAVDMSDLGYSQEDVDYLMNWQVPESADLSVNTSQTDAGDATSFSGTNGDSTHEDSYNANKSHQLQTKINQNPLPKTQRTKSQHINELTMPSAPNVGPLHAQHAPFLQIFPQVDPAVWSIAAWQNGLSPRPSVVQVQAHWPLNKVYPVWLPGQLDFNHWHKIDQSVFMTRINTLVRGVNWEALDSYYGSQVQQRSGLVQVPQFTQRPLRTKPSVQTPVAPSEPSHGHSAQLQQVQLGVQTQAPVVPTASSSDVQIALQEQRTGVTTAAGAIGDNIVSNGTDSIITEMQPDRALSEQEPPKLPSEATPSANPQFTRGTESVLSAELALELDDLVERFSTEDARTKFLETHDETWSPPAPDETIPENDEDAIKHVKELLRAMVSTERAADSVRDNSFKTRWMPQKLGKPIYDKAKMTVRCWEIVKLAVALHIKGPSALGCFDHLYTPYFARTKQWTFQQRIDAIVRLFESRKSRCDMAIKGENLDAIVGNPDKLNKNSVQNGMNNDRKADEIKRGRLVKKEEEELAAKKAAESDPTNTNTNLDAAHDGSLAQIANHPGQADQVAMMNGQETPQAFHDTTETQAKEKRTRNGKGKAAATQQETKAPNLSAGSCVLPTIAGGSGSSRTSGQSTIPSPGQSLQQVGAQSTTSQSPNQGSKRKRPAGVDSGATPSPPPKRGRKLLASRSAASTHQAHTSTSQESESPKQVSTFTSTKNQPAPAAPPSFSRKRSAEAALEKTAPPKRVRPGKH